MTDAPTIEELTSDLFRCAYDTDVPDLQDELREAIWATDGAWVRDRKKEIYRSPTVLEKQLERAALAEKRYPLIAKMRAEGMERKDMAEALNISLSQCAEDITVMLRIGLLKEKKTTRKKVLFLGVEYPSIKAAEAGSGRNHKTIIAWAKNPNDKRAEYI